MRWRRGDGGRVWDEGGVGAAAASLLSWRELGGMSQASGKAPRRGQQRRGSHTDPVVLPLSRDLQLSLLRLQLAPSVHLIMC